MFENLNVDGKSMEFDYIVCNPPYIKTKDCKTLPLSVRHYDPKLALDGGKDGLDFYNILAKQSSKYLKKDGKIFMEIGFEQGKDVIALFEKCHYITSLLKDYSNCDRIVIAKKDNKND